MSYKRYVKNDAGEPMGYETIHPEDQAVYDSRNAYEGGLEVATKKIAYLRAKKDYLQAIGRVDVELQKEIAELEEEIERLSDDIIDYHERLQDFDIYGY
jgi:predicted RNase H-like nuclease (RuvC/YqgF family)